MWGDGRRDGLGVERCRRRCNEEKLAVVTSAGADGATAKQVAQRQKITTKPGIAHQALEMLEPRDQSAAISMPDHNTAERRVRPIGIGRRNWLFAGSDTDGETLARAMTLIETTKMNDIDLHASLTLDRHPVNRPASIPERARIRRALASKAFILSEVPRIRALAP